MSFKKAEQNFKKQQDIDQKDFDFCKKNKILLWRIKYDEDKEKSILNLKNILGKE